MTIEFFKLNYEIKCQNHMSIVLDMAKFDVFVETANQSLIFSFDKKNVEL